MHSKVHYREKVSYCTEEPSKCLSNHRLPQLFLSDDNV